MTWRGAPRRRSWRYVASLAAHSHLQRSRTGRGVAADAAPQPRRLGSVASSLSQTSVSSAPAKGPGITTASVDETAIKSFLLALRRENELFDSTMHQDAHEFLNFLLNKIDEELSEASRKKGVQGVTTLAPNTFGAPVHSVSAGGMTDAQSQSDDETTCVSRLFRGVLTNETRCLYCETVTSRDEEFLDLSVNVSPDTSLSSCLRQFSESEMLRGRNKFFCDRCSSLQEAEKRMKIKSPPSILALHLKRFKWDEHVQAYVKLGYRVVFPFTLRLFNTSERAEDPDRLYELFGIVVHIGGGPNQGHFVSVVKVGSRWALFDDETVDFITEPDITRFYADSPDTGSAYVLFYRAVDLDAQVGGVGASPMRSRDQDKASTSPRHMTSPLSFSPVMPAMAGATPTSRPTTASSAMSGADSVRSASPQGSVALPVHAATQAGRGAVPSLDEMPVAVDTQGMQSVLSPRLAPIAPASALQAGGIESRMSAPLPIPTLADANAPLGGEVPASLSPPTAPQRPAGQMSPESPVSPLAAPPGAPRSAKEEESPGRRLPFARSALSRTLKLGRGASKAD